MGKYKSVFGEENLKRKMVLTGATLKSRIKKIPAREMLQDWFGKIEFVESKGYMRISENVSHEK